MHLLLPAFFIVPLLYAIIIVVCIVSLFKRNKRRAVPTHPFPGISIVIPFRNEADNLARLIDSLDAQTYPGASEILLVNDGSTDDFSKAIGRRSQQHDRPGLRIIESCYQPATRLTSKQQALDTGISAATYEWIALTDADMLLTPSWLETLIQPTFSGALLVFGHTSIFRERTGSFFHWLQSFQLEVLFSFAHAFNRAGITGSCMGNNMLISKQSFQDLGGFASIGYSIVEDLDLLAAFRKNKLPAAATEPFHISARTLPCGTISHYRQQLLRWAGGGFRKWSNLTFFGAVLMTHTALIFPAAAGRLPLIPSIAIMANLMATWLFIIISFNKNKSHDNPLFFPLFFMLFLVEALFVLVNLPIKNRIVWKERKW